MRIRTIQLTHNNYIVYIIYHDNNYMFQVINTETCKTFKRHYIDGRCSPHERPLTDLFHDLTDYVVENLNNMSLIDVSRTSTGYNLTFDISIADVSKLLLIAKLT